MVECLRLLEAVKPGPPVPDDEIGRRANAVVEGALLADILDVVPQLSKSHAWAVHARKLVAGQFWAGEEGDGSRDEQLELWIAAQAIKAGATAVLAEPDVVVDVGDLRFVVAAKRPRSQETLRGHFKKAVEQITASGHRGLVAVDLSQVLGLHQHVMVVDDFSQGQRDLAARMKSATANGEFSRWVRAADHKAMVVGVVATLFTSMIHRKTAGIVATLKIVGGPIHLRSVQGVTFFRKLMGMRGEVGGM